MQYQFFYEDYVEGKRIPSDKPVETDLGGFIHSMQCVLHSEGNFIGLVDGRGDTLQFIVNSGDESITLDIPKPEDGGSYAMDGPLNYFVKIMQQINDEPFDQQIKGLEFRSWSEPKPKQPTGVLHGDPMYIKPWWKFW